MAETAAYLVDQVAPRVPVRQWALSFPMPLRILFAAHAGLLTPLLRSVHRLITGFLHEQAGLKRGAADTGAVTLIQIRLGRQPQHPPPLPDARRGVSLHRGGAHLQVRVPTDDKLKGLLDKLIVPVMKMLTRSGHLVEGHGVTYLAQTDSDHPLAALQAASCTYRIAFVPRAGHKVLSLHTVARREGKNAALLCADAHGFSLHAAVRFASDQRKELERLCRCITRPALANERMNRNAKGQVVLQLKSSYRDGATHIVMQPQEFMQRLAAPVPCPRLRLIRFREMLAPHAKLRAAIVPGALRPTNEPAHEHAHGKAARMSRARLLKRVFDIDVEHCACGGELKIIAAIEDPAVIVRILTHRGLPKGATPAPRHGRRRSSRRADPQDKRGCAIGLAIRRSRMALSVRRTRSHRSTQRPADSRERGNCRAATSA